MRPFVVAYSSWFVRLEDLQVNKSWYCFQQQAERETTG